MSKTATVRARIEPDLKIRVEHIFQKLGLSTTEAINLFYKQVELQQGLPFEVKIPNEITQKTLEKTDRGEELNHCDNLENMFEQLGI
ncbi:type II toxin-antitoxin system RelB/DinJ family antitoxin [Cyanobacterium aponinum FACHB-4101]|uniref:type II toxin-antitoxin system RelB/DinJ family antitoxin n=1 Tax=Cyanobacterium aponinum TaxID=379064 RepID=UPI0016818F6B|nr:type II toxin-antitoxin system RelB/DinJ family antitoxin [Cyanobacterium aponinum]MBD2395634.1 type II toxin-antitoxin system RelB/DinJ family antitoxin [Cyanobacterium aponinum FACHB-4101]